VTIVTQPVVKAPRADALEREQQAQRDEFAGIQMGLGTFGLIVHDLIDAAIDPDDTIDDRHAKFPCPERTAPHENVVPCPSGACLPVEGGWCKQAVCEIGLDAVPYSTLGHPA